VLCCATDGELRKNSAESNSLLHLHVRIANIRRNDQRKTTFSESHWGSPLDYSAGVWELLWPARRIEARHDDRSRAVAPVCNPRTLFARLSAAADNRMAIQTVALDLNAIQLTSGSHFVGAKQVSYGDLWVIPAAPRTDQHCVHQDPGLHRSADPCRGRVLCPRAS